MEKVQTVSVNNKIHRRRRISSKVYKKTGIQTSPTKRQFTIYHRVNEELYKPEEERQPRKFITQVVAEDMQDAYKLAQVHSKEITGRATTIGDLIQDNYGYYLIQDSETEPFKLLCLNDDEGGE